MTIANITQGIVNALYAQFGSGYTYYTESVKQSLNEPCFLIRCLEPYQSHAAWHRHKRLHPYVIQYFPLVMDSIAECTQACEAMLGCLGDIIVSGDVVHSSDMQGQIIDGVLTFTVNYDVFLLESHTDESDMATVTSNVDIG